MTDAATSFTLASFNVHWGGRYPDGRSEYDLEAVTRTLDADVRVFQEVWHHPEEPSRVHVPDGFVERRLVVARWPRPARFELPSPRAARIGDFCIALATRFEILEEVVLHLPATRTDPRCRALAVHLATTLGPVWVIAVHFTIGMVPLGSALQAVSLGRQVPPNGPAVIVGDHNLWGPPARLAFGRAWRPAVRGKTWQVPRPRHQIDHIWTRGLGAADGRVLPPLGSDHLPIAATITAR